ncbi:MAG: hypothetical protein FJZ59_02420 [Chlamydiae bacterium]|jgi:hypothetical protein|nr:hypothetical protein [Chlamydiota bacterium]
MKTTHGILVATDNEQEWILKWWWENYIRYNSYPVAFVDFGMSPEMVLWCKEKGALIPFTHSIEVRSNFKIRKMIEAIHTNKISSPETKKMLSNRNAWFKKPQAFTLTPFEKTIWIDLDCEILGSLDPLFAYNGLALAKNVHKIFSYNSGVVVYEKNCSLIQKWAMGAEKASEHFVGDENYLTFLILSENRKVNEMPPEYNWTVDRGLNLDVLIFHWLSPQGKKIIKNFGGLSYLLGQKEK